MSRLWQMVELRGVPLPPGPQVVIWNYRPTSFYWGAAISAVALIGLVVFACLPQRMLPPVLTAARR